MESYAYSVALKAKEGPWTFAELNEWLKKPSAYASVVHVWTAPGAQGVMCNLAYGTSAVMCSAFDAAG